MDNSRELEAKEIVEKYNKDWEMIKVEELIRDNKISFEHNGENYQVRLLNQKEKDELDNLRRKKFNSLLQEKDEQGNYVYLTEKAIIKVLKERKDVDIAEVDEEINKIESEEKNIQFKLGESISKNDSETVFQAYKEKIEDLRLKKQILNTQRNLVLEFSLENQLLSYVYKIIAYLSLYKKVDKEWIRAFNNLEDFINCKDEGLVIMASQYSLLLQYSI